MKIFKIDKENLIWKNMNQIEYNWKLPILVNDKKEVILGNSLHDLFQDKVFVCIVDQNNFLEDSLFYLETKLVQENDFNRIGIIDSYLRDYFKLVKKPLENIKQLSMFDDAIETEYRTISEELYIPPDENITYAHGLKNNNGVTQLSFFEDEEKKYKDDIEIDLEILKELL